MPSLSPSRGVPLHSSKGIKMFKSASPAPSIGVFGRLLANIDRLLLSSARIAVRNGDLPHFGL